MNRVRIQYVLGAFVFALACVLHLAGAPAASADAQPVLMDGDFGDWAAIPHAVQDPSGDGGGSGIDFGRMWLANDGPALFIRIELGTDLLMQEPNSLILYIDTDNNSSTGTSVAGMGADLTWQFGNRSGTYSGSNIGWDDIGIITSPSYTATDFEISVNRSAAPNGNALFPSSTVRIAFRDNSGGGDWIPSSSTNITYVFDDSDPQDPPLIDLARNDAGNARIMTLNTHNDGLWNDPNENERILQAIDPDIIAYQEIYNHSAGVTQAWVEARLSGTWSSDSDGQLKTLSRYPILQSWTPVVGRAFATLIDLPATFDHDVLVINLHFSCCTNNSARQDQVDEMMAFVRDAISPGGSVTLADNTPIVILGDTNMYGDAEQVTTLLTGDILDNGTYGPDFAPDWDGSDLEEILSRQPTVRQSYTWYNEGSSYGPSHIDRITVTGSVMNLDKSYILHTTNLPASVLSAYGLNAGDSEIASDHIAHVLDMAPTSVTTDVAGLVPFAGLQFTARPNPFNPTTNIAFELDSPGLVEIEIYDPAGRLVESLASGYFAAGRHSITWSPGSRTGSGVYFARMEWDGRSAIRKLNLVR